MKTLTNISSMLVMAMGITLISAYTTTRKPPEIAKATTNQVTAQLPAPLPEPLQPNNAAPKRLKININITNPEDLKVKEGDLVKAGQILADKDRERKRLTGQRDKLNLPIKQTHFYNLTKTNFLVKAVIYHLQNTNLFKQNNLS